MIPGRQEYIIGSSGRRRGGSAFWKTKVNKGLRYEQRLCVRFFKRRLCSNKKQRLLISSLLKTTPITLKQLQGSKGDAKVLGLLLPLGGVLLHHAQLVCWWMNMGHHCDWIHRVFDPYMRTKNEKKARLTSWSDYVQSSPLLSFSRDNMKPMTPTE